VNERSPGYSDRINRKRSQGKEKEERNRFKKEERKRKK